MEDPNISFIVLAMIAAIVAATLNFGEAFGVASPISIILPAGGDGSIATVCGILGLKLPRTIQCSTISPAGAGKAFDIYPNPNASFYSISSGRDIICGLQQGGPKVFCWQHVAIGKGSSSSNQILKYIYHESVLAIELVVDEEQIAFVGFGHIFGLRVHSNSSTPHLSVPGGFRSITSGAGFICAINFEDKVVCFGPKAKDIYPAFEDEEMSAIFSGESHACGITKQHRVICGGNNDRGQSSPPDFDAPNEITTIALGSTHSCAIGGSVTSTVVCWGDGVGEYFPSKDLSLATAVAGWNLTCGVRNEDLAVVCWWASRGAPAKLVQLPLSRDVLYGFCVPRNRCACGIEYGSKLTCADDNVICEPCT